MKTLIFGRKKKGVLENLSHYYCYLLDGEFILFNHLEVVFAIFQSSNPCRCSFNQFEGALYELGNYDSSLSLWWWSSLVTDYHVLQFYGFWWASPLFFWYAQRVFGCLCLFLLDSLMLLVYLGKTFLSHCGTRSCSGIMLGSKEIKILNQIICHK